METASNAGTLQWLIGRILLAYSHEAGHLILRELDLAAAESGQRLINKSINSVPEIRKYSASLTISATLNLWAGAAIVRDEE